MRCPILATSCRKDANKDARLNIRIDPDREVTLKPIFGEIDGYVQCNVCTESAGSSTLSA